MSFDHPYVKKQKQKVIEMEQKNPMWQPQLYKPEVGLHHYDQLTGGKLKSGQDSHSNSGSGQTSVGFNNFSEFNTLYKRVPRSYKSSGNQGNYYYHSNELDNINKSNSASRNYKKNNYKNSNQSINRNDVEIFDKIMENMNSDFDLRLLSQPSLRSGAGVKKLLSKEAHAEKAIREQLMKAIELSQNKEHMRGGSIDSDSLKDALKKTSKIGRRIAPTIVKTALPPAAAAVAQALGLPAPAGLLLGKIASDILVNDVIKKKSKKKSGGVGVYSGGKNSNNVRNRSLLIKKIMASKGMSLPEASRYIKSNNLKY
jgi:hypothetical protein